MDIIKQKMSNNNINQDTTNLHSEELQFNGYGDIMIPGINDNLIPVEISNVTHFTSNAHELDYDIATDVDSSADTDIDSVSDTDSISNYNQGEEKSSIVTGVVRATQTETETETPCCGVCYKELNIDNNVTTKCNHHFCTSCFFRWLEVNATCPSCRGPIDSNTNLTDEQLDRENKEVYQDYMELLNRHCYQVLENKRQLYEMFELKEKTNSLLKRQITLREQMQETEGYNEGYMAAAYQFFHGEKKMKHSALLTTNRNNKSFMKGYYDGMDMESRRLNKLAKKFKQIPKKNIKIKKRKIQKTLWDCGVTNSDDIDPISRVTVGLTHNAEDDS